MPAVAPLSSSEAELYRLRDKINALIREVNALLDTGTGDVSGPSSATDGKLAVFSGTTGKAIRAFASGDASGARTDIGAVSTARQILSGGLATGGGDLTADRTITVPAASQGEAEAGTDNTKAMTPLRTAEAIAALAGGSGLTQLATGSLSGSTFGFTGLSQDYSALVIVYAGLSTDSTSGRPIGRYSTDNGSSYASSSGDYHTAQNGAAPTATSAINLATGPSATSATCDGVIIIFGYAGAAKKLAHFINVSSETADNAAGFCFLNTTGAINAFRLETLAGSFDAGTLTIYGMA